MRVVADAAGVSPQTVSKVVNHKLGVSAAVRDRITRIMQDLNYQPNVGARWLRTGVAASIGLINGEQPKYGQAGVVYGVERAARQAGYYSTVAGIADVSGTTLQEAVDRLISLSVAGIIINFPVPTGSRVFDDLVVDVPVVGIWVPVESPFPVATCDHFSGARVATEHLLRLGHKTVYHVAGQAGQSGTDERVAGWRSALEGSGARVPEFHHGDWTARSGYQLGAALVADPEVTAVFAANDATALGLMTRLREAGREVPRDVSVVGYDDIPEAEFFSPHLTTIRQDFLELGARGFALLDEQIMGQDTPTTPRSAPAQLIVRASTAPPGAAVG
jgi:DNA-binding LacI/PurR family transcriptional regulator